MIARWTAALAVIGAGVAMGQGRATDGVYAGKRRVATHNEHVFSVSNANDEYTFWLETRRGWNGVWPELRLAGSRLRASSTGSGVTRGFHTVSFQLDRANADRIATLYNIPRRDRIDLSGGVRWKFRPKKASFAATEPVSIELEVWSDNPTPVAMVLGGRNRGPRNNRFDFEVFKSGQTLPIKVAHDFGGLSTTIDLGRGKKHAHPTADLRAWTDLPPGAYTVRCHYQAELVDPNSHFARWPEHGHQKWDLTLDGDVTVLVH